MTSEKHRLFELEVIRKARSGVDYYLAVYMLRDLDIVKEAGLSDYAWELYRDINVCDSDVDLLFEKLDEYLLGQQPL